jgi:hypothetical protein
MIDITDELRRYKELMPVWRKYMDSDWDEFAGKNVDDYPKRGDPRLREYCRIEKNLREIALDSDSVVIKDPTLHRIFHEIRKDVLEDTIGENGTIFTDDFFYHLADKYHPNGIAQRLSITRPLVTLNEVPAEIEALITETREAFCLDLPTACISLCRSVVERAIVDIAVRSGRLEHEYQAGNMGMCDRISLLLDRSVSRTSPLRKEINDFMRATSDVIHTNATADMASARRLFEKAQELIQKLYGYYKSQLKK